jgi:hypothetical protein
MKDKKHGSYQTTDGDLSGTAPKKIDGNPKGRVEPHGCDSKKSSGGEKHFGGKKD